MRESGRLRPMMALLAALAALAGLVLAAGTIAEANGGGHGNAHGHAAHHGDNDEQRNSPQDEYGNRGDGHTPVTICHLTGNGKFVVITVDDDGAFHGHTYHGGDIIPAPAAGCPGGEPVSTETAVATETPPAGATVTPTSASGETATATNTVSGATATNTAVTAATATNTAVATNTSEAAATATQTGAATATGTATGGAAAAEVSATPAAGVAGAATLPSAGTGHGSEARDVVLALCVLAVTGGSLLALSLYQRSRA